MTGIGKNLVQRAMPKSTPQAKVRFTMAKRSAERHLLQPMLIKMNFQGGQASLADI